MVQCSLACFFRNYSPVFRPTALMALLIIMDIHGKIFMKSIQNNEKMTQIKELKNRTYMTNSSLLKMLYLFTLRLYSFTNIKQKSIHLQV